MRHTFPPLALLFALSTAPAQEAGKDALGDPLPKGAVARLGTERMKNFDGYGTRLHPDGKRLIVNVRGKMTLADPTTGDLLGAFGKGDRIPSALSADGKRAAAATFDGFVVWDVESGKVAYEEKGRPVGYDDSLNLTADGKYLAVGGRVNEKMKDKGVTVTVYDVDEKKESARLKVAQNSSAKIVLSGDGKRAATWGYHYEPTKPGGEADEEKNPSRLIQFWDVAKEAELGSGRLSAGFSIASVAIAPAGDVAAASTGDGTVTVFDTATGKTVRELVGRARLGGNLTFSPDGKALATAASDGAIQLWEVGTGKSLGLAPSPAAVEYLTIQGIVFTGPASAHALAQIGGTTVVWEVPTGKVISPTAGHRQGVTGVTFSPDGKEVLSTGYYGETVRWDTAGKKLGEVKLAMPGTAPALVNSARVLIPACGTQAVRMDGGGMGVYELPGGSQQFFLASASGSEAPVGASADGKILAVAVPPGDSQKPKPAHLQVIDVATNSKTREVVLGPGTITAVVVTPDGSKAGVFRLDQTGKDAKVVFCGVDLKEGKVLGETEEKGYSTPFAAATPDGKGVLVSQQNKPGLVVFDLATGEKTREVKEFKTYVSAAPVFSKDGKQVAVVGDPSGTPKVTVLDWETGKVTHTYSGHIKGVSCLAFSPDGKMLASGSYDTTVLLWDLTKE